MFLRCAASDSSCTQERLAACICLLVQRLLTMESSRYEPDEQGHTWSGAGILDFPGWTSPGGQCSEPLQLLPQRLYC